MEKHSVIIAGLGLSALASAARLTELGVEDIVMFGNGFGGTPYIAGINFVLPESPYEDSIDLYTEDMLKAGYGIADRSFVAEMTAKTVDGYELLKRWDVVFAHNDDDSIKLRHLSGHTYPRTLCRTTNLIGEEMIHKLLPGLKAKNVLINSSAEVVELLHDENGICGVKVKTDGELKCVYAPVVIAAWGGVGNLLGTSTYPDDVQGNVLGMAKAAGAELIDLEFLEYEPMVVAYPPGAVGEPCPTAMLGEGAHLLNAAGERFLLSVRPQGEAGAPKSLINREAWKQINNGKGGPNGGVFVDLRHIKESVLKSYPWFYERLMNNGLNPKEELVEVAPMAHSFSGGIKVNKNYESKVPGLYAVGEACGGIHGACRCAGNAASQALLSGIICAEAIAGNPEKTQRPVSAARSDYKENKTLQEKYLPELKQLAHDSLGYFRKETDLINAKEKLQGIISVSGDDTRVIQTCMSIDLMLTAALERKESRGTHNRLDYPDQNKEYEKEIVL